jgi:hypothetical protein
LDCAAFFAGALAAGFAAGAPLLSFKLDLPTSDTVPSLLIDLVETDFLGFGRRGEKRDWAGDQRKVQKALQKLKSAAAESLTIGTAIADGLHHIVDRLQ